MGWDEVCVFCGITPVCGPTQVILNHTRDKFVQEMASEMLANNLVDMPLEKIASLIMEFLSTPEWEQHRYSGHPYCGEIAHLGYEGDVLAVGHFDDQGQYSPCSHTGRVLHPTGDAIDLRRVRSVDSSIFAELVEYVRGERVVTGRWTVCTTVEANWVFNTFIHVNCFAYLQNWLHCSLPPRVGRLGTPLELASELYEVVNSRRDPPIEEKGALPCIDYNNVLLAYEGAQYMGSIAGCRTESVHTAKALEEGLRGEQLLSAFLKDCQYYMFMRPDNWPMAGTPPTGIDLEWTNSTIAEFAIDQPQATVAKLPLELFSEICQHLDLSSIFALSFSCKALYSRVLERSTLTYALRRSMSNPDGALRWLPPITSLREERERAHLAMLTWIPGNPITDCPVDTTFGLADFPEDDQSDVDFIPDDSEIDSDVGDSDTDGDSTDSEADSNYSDEGLEKGDIEDIVLPPQEYVEPPLESILLFDPDFPILPFVRACYMSDHMKSRRRRWRIIKQFDGLWANYRREGWERNDFTPESITWSMVDGRYVCQCVPT